MATFEVKVYKLRIESHPNADRLELCCIGDYRSVVMKGQFKTNDLGVYIPTGAVVPDWIIEKLGLVGRLAGPQHNRVKAIKLRQILSEGLIYPVEDINPEKAICDAILYKDETGFHHHVIHEGMDVTKILGITKYEPPIPIAMSGEVFNAFGYTISFDVESYKKFPNILKEGEYVVISEKGHGTWCCYGYHPEVESHIITSKGLSAKGLAFKINEANKNNLYLRTLETTQQINGNVIDHGVEYFGGYPFYILGEVLGLGVQDLTYGFTSPQFRAFDIYLGASGHGRYLNVDEFKLACADLQIETVPFLYEGLYNKEKLLELTDGMETFSGKETNIREGVVVKPVVERRHDEIGRVQLKNVSDAYLMRGNDENTTEFT